MGHFSSTAKRPPVEETASFLQSLLASHGPNYLEKLFGSKARDALEPLGGVEKVAIALSGQYGLKKKLLSVVGEGTQELFVRMELLVVL